MGSQLSRAAVAPSGQPARCDTSAGAAARQPGDPNAWPGAACSCGAWSTGLRRGGARRGGVERGGCKQRCRTDVVIAASPSSYTVPTPRVNDVEGPLSAHVAAAVSWQTLALPGWKLDWRGYWS